MVVGFRLDFEISAYYKHAKSLNTFIVYFSPGSSVGRAAD